MTLESTLLEKLSEWPAATSRQNLYVEDGDWSVTVRADRSDALGCLVWDLEMRRLVKPNALNVATWASAVATGVKGLIEPLKVVEVDTELGEAQLRSDPPMQRLSKKMYYEVILTSRGRATVSRYQAVDSASGREQIAFVLMHEAIARLAQDVIDAAKSK